MSIIERNRTLRPSTRKVTSKSYKINTKNVSVQDELVVYVHSEQKELMASFHFSGRDIAGKDSIHFYWINDRIEWGMYESLIQKQERY